MKVTFVLPYAGLAGGIRVVAVYADRLRRRGHQVCIVSVPRPRPSVRARLGAICQATWLPLRNAHGPSHLDGLGLDWRVLDRFRAPTDTDVPDGDVVVATWWKTAEWVQVLSPRKGAKAYFIQGYEVAPGRNSPEVDATWRLPMAKIVISEWLAKLAGDRFGDERTLHVPNSVDLDQFHAPPRNRQPRPTVGLLYSRSPFKDWSVSLAALRTLTAALPNLRVISFGAERPNRALPLPAGAEFVYCPAQASIRELYSQCDVWLCGSAREGFHLPPLEAMACRCPVVSTRVGGPMDIIRDGINGFLVDVGDHRGLCDRVLKVLRFSNARWQLMSQEAFKTASGYSWDQATDRFEQALNQIVGTDQTSDECAFIPPSHLKPHPISPATATPRRSAISEEVVTP